MMYWSMLVVFFMLTAAASDTALGSCSDDNILYNCMLQMNLDLKYLTERLADVINASNYPKDAGVGTGPVMSIGYILNYHYECLVDIEDAYVKCKTALENLQKIQNQISSSGSMNC
uniref:Uncharacterized protein n=1 Tax=Lygus hesperus TaxID=30085 RepID=A0A0A9Z962_LYGHE